MNKSALQIKYSSFNNIYDNKVKPLAAPWNDLSKSLISVHPVVAAEKNALPSFNAWLYKGIDDPTIDHGTDDFGKPLKRFSATHVRRLMGNLVSMSMLVIDFDGGMRIDDVQSQFGSFEYVCYTSLNHRAEGKDKFRVVLPFINPMPVDDFRRLCLAIHQWIDGDECDVADPKTYSIGQVFVLPAVHEEDIAMARAWRNEGALLDWRIFEAVTFPSSNPVVSFNEEKRDRSGANRLLPEDVLITLSGVISVKDIDRKISDVLCPFHADVTPSEFVSLSQAGLPYLRCKRCGTIGMARSNGGDGIVSGLAKIAERKHIRSLQEDR